MKLNINIGDVSETAFLTIFSHAMDAQSEEPILGDTGSIDTVKLLSDELASSDKILHKKLLKGKTDKRAAIHIVIRAKQYDRYIRKFIDNNPGATIVNIGCGLDNRFERVDNGEINFYDLDLPDIIKIKQQLFPETDRYKLISQSVLEFDWMDRIEGKNIMFVAEGVLMYLQEEDVKSLFLTLQERFPGSEMLCEVFNSMWLKDWWNKMMEVKLQKQLELGKDAMFHFGIRESEDIESWNKGLKLLGEWSYFDSDEKKLGYMKMFRNFKLFRKTQWTVHYLLGK